MLSNKKSSKLEERRKCRDKCFLSLPDSIFIAEVRVAGKGRGQFFEEGNFLVI